MTPLEKSLPIEQLNPVALAEGNSKKPVYRIHKWWARRLGSVFRLLTLAAFKDSTTGDAALWKAFREGGDLKGKIVLDPFMGGGTTIVEALRLGCRVVGVDINPVAWFVTKKQAEPVDLEQLDAAFHHLEKTAGARIRPWYQTKCPAGHEAEVMYTFWVKRAACAHCGEETRLFPNHLISRREREVVSCCPHCLAVNASPTGQAAVDCADCGHAYDPAKGVAGRGKFTCGHCGEEGRILEVVRRQGHPLAEEPHALEGYCDDCGRFYKKMDQADHRLWEQAREEFRVREPELLFPRQAIPAEGRSDPRPINHGYTHYHQMFNARQLICLSALLEEILKLEDANIRELMLAAFSDCLDANTMFCKYETAWHKISLFFGLHAYHPIERPTENNVWGTRFGRGTFVKCFEKMRKAKVFCEAPWERLSDGNGGRISQLMAGERIAARLVRDFDQLENTPNAALLRCQSSGNLDFLPDGSVDAVMTDPPYFDNVAYSELADFFHVWLRLALKGTYPWFEREGAGHSGEILKNDRQGKDLDFFNEGLKQVFRECHRVLKDDGLMVFTFHHNQCWAWEGLGDLLLEAGFYVSACPIVRSEGKSGFHSSEGNIKYDCVLVCRKAPLKGVAASRPALEAGMLRETLKWGQRTLESGMPLGRSDTFAILMGQTLMYYTSAITQGESREDWPLGQLLKQMGDLTGELRDRMGD